MKHNRLKSDSKYDTCYAETAFAKVVPWLTLGVACVQIIKEFFQVYYLGRIYLKEVVNWFEFTLYTTTLLFMIPFIMCQLGANINTKTIENMKWQAGVISILFAWFNLLFYLKRLPFIGLYVVMFTEVLTTLVNVLLVFSIILVAFSLAFFTLVDVQPTFASVALSIVKNSVMMVGELEYDSMFTENISEKMSKNLPYDTMTYLVFLCFVVIVVIVIMNLLVNIIYNLNLKAHNHLFWPFFFKYHFL